MQARSVAENTLIGSFRSNNRFQKFLDCPGDMGKVSAVQWSLKYGTTFKKEPSEERKSSLVIAT